jgi:HEPN domain-containing protein
MTRETRSWASKAESDLRVDRNEAAFPQPERDAVCFHCLPSAEKYLKAALCKLGLPIPPTRDLQRLLLDLLPHESSLKPFRRLLVSLSRFAVDYRYPGFSASTRDMHAALRHAERIRLKVRMILGLPP